MGRERYLATVERFLADVEGGPGALVITGEPGVGKSTLLSAALSIGRKRSFQVLVAAPAEFESLLSFNGLGDLCEPLSDEVISRLPGVQQEALRIALLRAPASGRAADQRTVSVACLEVLRLLSQKAPVIVAVDDSPWLDSPSARVLMFAARRLSREPITFCWTTRDPREDRLAQLSSIVPKLRHREIRLGPMGREAIERIIEMEVGVRLPRSLTSRIHRACQGNPFYAIQLGRALLDKPGPLRPGEPLPIPQELQALLHERLAALSPTTQRALLTASALFRPTLESVSAALDRDARRPLASAVNAGLIKIDGNDVRFVHPLLASAAYLRADAESRRRVHRRLAEVVDDPEERARHLLVTARGSDRDIAAALDAGADIALARGAPDSAAELREQAAALTPGEASDEARTRGLLAAQHYLTAGELDQARTILVSWLEKTPPGPRRAEILHLLARVSWVGDSFRDAAALLEQALIEAQNDDGVLTAVELEMGFVLAQVGDLRSSSKHGSSALQKAVKLDNPSLLAQVLAGTSAMDLVVGRPFNEAKLKKAIDLELSLGGSELLVSPSLMAALIYMWLGRMEESRALFSALDAIVSELGHESSVPVVLGLWGGAVQAECWAGELEKATHHAHKAVEAATRVGGKVARGLSLSALSCVLAYRGDPEATRKAAEEAAALLEEAGMSALCMWPLGVIGMVELSQGNAATACQTLAQVAQIVPSAGVGEPAAVPFVPDAVEALVGSGDLRSAASLVQWLEERANTLGRPWTLAMAARCRGLFMAAQGELDEAIVALDRAVEQFRELPIPIEIARTLLAQGALLRRRKQKRAAKDALQRALEIFDAVGARLWAERTRSELRRIGLRPSAPLDLTATEKDVARLAAAGFRTKDIASELFMSPKTVESVIGRIYRKLGVGSRAQLATLLAERNSSQVG